MARPPQYERDPDLTRDVTAVKAAVKRLTPEDRAQLLAWMLLYFQDDGMMFSRRRSADGGSASRSTARSFGSLGVRSDDETEVPRIFRI